MPMEIQGLDVTVKEILVTERCLAHVTFTTAGDPVVTIVAAVLRHQAHPAEEPAQL